MSSSCIRGSSTVVEAEQLAKAAFRPVLKRFPAAIVLERG